jgi:hypothetical protein
VQHVAGLRAARGAARVQMVMPRGHPQPLETQNMTEAIFLSLALLVPACSDEPTVSFGIDVHALASDRPPEFAQGMCRDPGEFSSSVGVSIDAPADGELNQLFLESDADAEDNVYHLRVYVAAERDPGQVWWEPGEILAERTYEHQFGELQEQDSFVVDYDGVRYSVDVVGLPAASTCAARAADSVDAVQ